MAFALCDFHLIFFSLITMPHIFFLLVLCTTHTEEKERPERAKILPNACGTVFFSLLRMFVVKLSFAFNDDFLFFHHFHIPERMCNLS
jgi:hypothetical protein